MGDPHVTMGFNTKSWSNDLDDFGYPHDLGNLEMALTSIGDPFFRAVDSYRIESSETLWQNTVDNQSQWWRLEHILEVRSVQSCFSFWWTWTFQGWSTSKYAI